MIYNHITNADQLGNKKVTIDIIIKQSLYLNMRAFYAER